MSQPDNVKPLRPRTLRLWKEIEAKVDVESKRRGLSFAKTVNVILSEALRDVEPEPDSEPDPLPDIATHDAF